MVRIMRRGTMHQQFFSDAEYGGKQKAKQAAIEHRKKLERELPASAKITGRKTKRNTTGQVGIHLATDYDKRCDTTNFSYVASWKNEDGKRINVKFGWQKYGQKTAWQLACVARQNRLTDRSRILSLHAKRETRFPSVPDHPDIDGAIRPVKKKSVRRRKAQPQKSRRKK